MTGILETLELREGGLMRQQHEISRKLKAAEKRSQRQRRTTDKPKGETEEPKSAAAAGADKATNGDDADHRPPRFRSIN